MTCSEFPFVPGFGGRAVEMVGGAEIQIYISLEKASVASSCGCFWAGMQKNLKSLARLVGKPEMSENRRAFFSEITGVLFIGTVSGCFRWGGPRLRLHGLLCGTRRKCRCGRSPLVCGLAVVEISPTQVCLRALRGSPGQAFSPHILMKEIQCGCGALLLTLYACPALI